MAWELRGAKGAGQITPDYSDMQVGTWEKRGHIVTKFGSSNVCKW